MLLLVKETWNVLAHLMCITRTEKAEISALRKRSWVHIAAHKPWSHLENSWWPGRGRVNTLPPGITACCCTRGCSKARCCSPAPKQPGTDNSLPWLCFPFLWCKETIQWQTGVCKCKAGWQTRLMSEHSMEGDSHPILGSCSISTLWNEKQESTKKPKSSTLIHFKSHSCKIVANPVAFPRSDPYHSWRQEHQGM